MEDKPVKSLQQLAKEALEVQDACNLSGVVHGFSRAMRDLCQHVQNTRERNNHPISILWACKIADLTGAIYEGEFSKAYTWCADMAKGKQ